MRTVKARRGRDVLPYFELENGIIVLPGPFTRKIWREVGSVHVTAATAACEAWKRCPALPFSEWDAKVVRAFGAWLKDVLAEAKRQEGAR